MASTKRKTGHKKPDWYKQTEYLLRRKKELPIEIENLKLQLELDRISGPSIISKYSLATGNGTYAESPTENTVMKYISKEEQIEERRIMLEILENTINSLSPEEYQIYALRYESELRDYEVYEKIGICRSSYFEAQKRMIMKAARLIGILPSDDA